MQISALETLATIAREKSFSRTAEIRNMTLSAVSMQMKALEEELGASLFDRSFRPPKLTPIGQQVAEDASQIALLQAVMRGRCLQNDALAGTIEIGFVPSAAARILPDFLERANRLAPNAVLNITTGLSEQLCEQVRAGQLDACVVTNIADASFDLDCTLLAREEMVVAAPADATQTNLVALSKALPFIHFVPSSGIGKLIAHYGKQMKLEPTTVINLDSIEAIVHCVARGLGYSLLPRPDVQRYGHENVRIFPCTPKPLYRDMSLATREDTLSQAWRPHLLSLLQPTT